MASKESGAMSDEAFKGIVESAAVILLLASVVFFFIGAFASGRK